MSMRVPQRGAPLPYKTLAGVVPCSPGWLVASAKLQGITMSPEQPQVFRRFTDVLDYKPAFSVIALFSPVGLLEEPTPRGRRCERDARSLLGMPRASAVVSAPVRRTLSAANYEEAVEANGGHLSAISWRLLPRIAEVDAIIAPYWQRTVFEVHPELSFFQLNDDRPVRYSKRSEVGRDERREMLKERLQGVDRILDARPPRISEARLLDAAACLWTARRVVSRAVHRLPEIPEWDGQGLRMEYVR